MTINRHVHEDLDADLADDRVDPRKLRAAMANLVYAVNALSKRIDALQASYGKELAELRDKATRTGAGKGTTR